MPTDTTEVFCPIQSLPNIDVRMEIESLHLRLSKLERNQEFNYQQVETLRQEQMHAQQCSGQVLVTYSKCTQLLSDKIDAIKMELDNAVGGFKDHCTKLTRDSLLIQQTMWTKRHEERMQERVKEIEMVHQMTCQNISATMPLG